MILPAVFAERLETIAEFKEIPAELAVICVLTCEIESATALDRLFKEPPKLPMDPYKPVTELDNAVLSEVSDPVKAEFTED